MKRQDRRTFVRSALAGAAPLVLPARTAQAAPRSAPPREDLVHYSGKAPTWRMTPLDETRLLATVDGPAGVISTDAARTWGAPVPYLQGNGPFAGNPHSVLRLKDGRLGMIYGKSDTVRGAGFATPTRTWLYAHSEDEGKHWSPGIAVDIPGRFEEADPKRNKGMHVAFPHGEMIQLASGRLIFPLYWYMGGRHPDLYGITQGPGHGTIKGHPKHRIDGHTYEAAMGGCYTYFSDDLGATWQRSTGSVMVWPLPSEGGGGFGATFEPVIVELDRGRVAMFMRTNMGRIFRTVSDDGGDHWRLAQPTDLASGDVPCYVGRLKTTGDLLAIWNQASAEEIRRGYSRGRLSTAVSKDQTESWSHFKTVERSDGLDAVDRVALPPVRHVRANRELGVLPDGYMYVHYPRLQFVQGKVVLFYHRANMGETGKWQAWEAQIKVVDEKWCYA